MTPDTDKVYQFSLFYCIGLQASAVIAQVGDGTYVIIHIACHYC